MAPNTTSGEIVRRLRALADLTQDRAAQLAHSSPEYISRVENGAANPTPQWVGNFAAAVGSYMASAAHPHKAVA